MLVFLLSAAHHRTLPMSSSATLNGYSTVLNDVWILFCGSLTIIEIAIWHMVVLLGYRVYLKHFS